MINLLKSTLTTVIVGVALTSLLYPLTKSFWPIFAVTIVGQYVLFYIIGNIIDFLGEIKLKQIEVLKLAEYSKQGMEVECPCYKKVKEFVPIVLNQKNTYKCSDCGKTNSVIIHADTASLTEPIQDPLSVIPLTVQNQDDRV